MFHKNFKSFKVIDIQMYIEISIKVYRKKPSSFLKYETIESAFEQVAGVKLYPHYTGADPAVFKG